MSAAPAVPEEREEASRFSTDGFAPVRQDMDSGAQMASGDDMESQTVTSGSAVALPAEWRGHWTSRFTTGLSECAPCALGTQSEETSCCQVSRPGPDWKIGDLGFEMLVSFPQQSDLLGDTPRFWPEVDYGCLGQGRGFLSAYWRCVDGSFDCAEEGLHGRLQLATFTCFYVERGYSDVFRPGTASCGARWNDSAPGVDTLLIAWNEIEVVPNAHYRGVGNHHPLFCPNPEDVHSWVSQGGTEDGFMIDENIRTKVALMKGGFGESSAECAASTDAFVGSDPNHWTCK